MIDYDFEAHATGAKVLGFYALRPQAKLPMKQTQGAACFDVHACCDDQITLKPGERALIPTGLIFDIPENYSVRVHTRSSWAAVKGIGMSVTEGIIDHDYVERHCRSSSRNPLQHLAILCWSLRVGEDRK